MKSVMIVMMGLVALTSVVVWADCSWPGAGPSRRFVCLHGTVKFSQCTNFHDDHGRVCRISCIPVTCNPWE